jgi:hypothetical protein
MCGCFIQLGGVQVYEVSGNGPALRTGQDAVDLMSAASEQRATWIVIPAARLGDEFFELRTRIAGEIAQKIRDVRCKGRDHRRHITQDGDEPFPRCLRR